MGCCLRLSLPLTLLLAVSTVSSYNRYHRGGYYHDARGGPAFYESTLGIVLFVGILGIGFFCICCRIFMAAQETNPEADEGTPCQCYLCGKMIRGKLWESGAHRKTCAQKNSSLLSSMKCPYQVHCGERNCGRLLRLWPQRDGVFYCDSCPFGRKSARPNDGISRLNCFLCDWDMCVDCAVERTQGETTQKIEDLKEKATDVSKLGNIPGWKIKFSGIGASRKFYYVNESTGEVREQNRPPILLLLGEEGKDMVLNKDLLSAAGAGDTQRLINLLDSGEEIDQVDGSGLTPLHMAAAEGRIQAVRLLLARGASLDKRTGEGLTALELANRENRGEVAALLHTATMAAQFPINQPPGAHYPTNQPLVANYPNNQTLGANCPNNQPPVANYPNNQTLGANFSSNQQIGRSYPSNQPMEGHYPRSEHLGATYPMVSTREPISPPGPPPSYDQSINFEN